MPTPRLQALTLLVPPYFNSVSLCSTPHPTILTPPSHLFSSYKYLSYFKLLNYHLKFKMNNSLHKKIPYSFFGCLSYRVSFSYENVGNNGWVALVGEAGHVQVLEFEDMCIFHAWILHVFCFPNLSFLPPLLSRFLTIQTS